MLLLLQRRKSAPSAAAAPKTGAITTPAKHQQAPAPKHQQAAQTPKQHQQHQQQQQATAGPSKGVTRFHSTEEQMEAKRNHIKVTTPMNICSVCTCYCALRILLCPEHVPMPLHTNVCPAHTAMCPCAYCCVSLLILPCALLLTASTTGSGGPHPQEADRAHRTPRRTRHGRADVPAAPGAPRRDAEEEARAPAAAAG
jgi:hypothetical protein